MGILAEIKTLYHITLKPVRGANHQARLESFYAGQAEDYDRFRRRLLKGREEMYEKIDLPNGGRWVDMGGGTGGNLEFVADRINRLKQVSVVDLSPSLLKRADQRIAQHDWENVRTVEADATTWQPDEGPVDVVTFSYSLTMIPDWFAAIDNALAMLKPGGRIGIVDFYVSRKYPPSDQQRHSYATRSFWPAWFSSDNVFPSPDHLPYLRRQFSTIDLSEHRTRTPYLFWTKMPYYIFIGEKRAEGEG